MPRETLREDVCFELNRLTLLTYNKINMKKLTFLKSLLMALSLLGGGDFCLGRDSRCE